MRVSKGGARDCMRGGARAAATGSARLRERPAVVGREFDPVLARCTRHVTECAQAHLAAMEQVFPAVAEIHRRDEVGLQPVRARAVGDLHAFEADHGLRVLARREGVAGERLQFPAVAGERHAFAVNGRDARIDPVVAAHELGRVQRARRAVQLGRRAFLLDAAVAQQQDAVGHRHRFGLVVRDAQGRQPERHDQFAQPGARFLAQLRVEVRQRFVEQDHRRVVDERARNRDALLLATRQLMRKAFREMAEAELVERGLHAALLFGRCDAAQLQPVADVVGDGTVRPQRVRLEHEAERALLDGQIDALRAVEEHAIVELDAAVGRLFKAGHRAQQRGLAAARRAEQAHDFAGLQFERHALEDRIGAIAEVQVVDDELIHEVSLRNAGPRRDRRRPSRC